MAHCYNNEGSFTCSCRTGYTGDGLTCDPLGQYTELNTYAYLYLTINSRIKKKQTNKFKYKEATERTQSYVICFLLLSSMKKPVEWLELARKMENIKENKVLFGASYQEIPSDEFASFRKTSNTGTNKQYTPFTFVKIIRNHFLKFVTISPVHRTHTGFVDVQTSNYLTGTETEC